MQKLNTLSVTYFLLFVLLASVAHSATAASLNDLSTKDVYQPQQQRRGVLLPAIDTEIFEAGVYTGVLNVEDFGGTYSTGANVTIHATEYVFLEGSAGRGTVTDEAFYRVGLPLFGADRNRAMTYYSLSVGYNLFPGEIFLGKYFSFGSSAFLLAGVGNINFMDDDSFAKMLGMGLKFLPKDWIAIRLDTKAYQYDTSYFGYKKTSHNFEAGLGVSLFF